ncbi:MAG: metal-dependent hydrolase [Carnobacterium sp.]|uniref:metal-dependent hydrolase n=1 Tax=Carnobacterium sp. TaxID=48221 RepID=UPI003314D8F4
MKISWHGQSCLQLLTDSGMTILMDPFITGNPKSDLDPNTVQADVIILTHGHGDHIGDTEPIAKRTGALIVANVEIASFFEKKGFETHGMQMGGRHQFDFGEVKMTPAIHGSSYEVEGEAVTLGLAAGIIFSADDQTIYHAGDTALFTDMKLIGAYKTIDVAFLPIGDNYTMGPEDAIIAASYIQAKKVVPIHYNTFPLIEQNAEEFCTSLSENQGLALKIGEVIDLSYM